MRLSLFITFIMMSFESFAQEQKFKIGDVAPNFKAVTYTGKEISLTSDQTTVLLFYRGYWCPYCNKQLSALNDSLSFITGKGARVIAVTPEKHESVEKTISKTKASFDIISDTTNAILKLYGVDFKVPEKTIAAYKNYGIDFTAVNGNNETTLPVPAVYVIEDGKIKYVWFEKDYRKRPSVKELAEHL